MMSLPSGIPSDGENSRSVIRLFSIYIEEMKKLLLSVMILSFNCVSIMTAQDISLKIVGGLSKSSLRQKMESNASLLLSEIEKASRSGSSLNLKGIDMTRNARETLTMSWDLYHLKCATKDNIVNVLTSLNGYEVRNIGVTLQPMAKYDGALERELYICFSQNGTITDVNLTIENLDIYNIVRGVDALDTRRRLEILKFVEDFRSYYDNKDVKALEAVFSDDALIVTGNVIKRMSKSKEMSRGVLKEEVIYNKKDKQQYLNDLRRVFGNNKYIKVQFDSIQVFRNGAKPNLYGVQLFQNWDSSQYRDKGYVFLYWEFRDEGDAHPIIHVRTWQPSMIGERPLSKKEIFNLNDFYIE